MKPFNKEWLNVGLGAVVFFLPLLGFPRGFKTAVFMIVGFVIAVNALRALRLLYRQERMNPARGGSSSGLENDGS